MFIVMYSMNYCLCLSVRRVSGPSGSGPEGLLQQLRPDQPQHQSRRRHYGNTQRKRYHYGATRILSNSDIKAEK